MDSIDRMLFDEARRALRELREQKYHEAERTLEMMVLMGEFLLHYRRGDPQALRMMDWMRRLDWGRTPEGRLEWVRWEQERERWRREWDRSPEWLREQARLEEIAREVENRYARGPV